MNRGAIKTAIKNEVDDQTVDDNLLNTWVQKADERVQMWRPLNDHDQSFDYWDYLKTEQPYTTSANQKKYPVPDNFRAFLELTIGTDTRPYTLIDFRGKPAADGQRYRALGNSMAVPVIAWIGERIRKAVEV